MGHVNQHLKKHIEETIIPQYAAFDKAHNKDHVYSVIENSLEIALDHDVNINMVYTIASYHDIGIMFGREHHHITSGQYLEGDRLLHQWFDQQQIRVMKEAVEDHRASNKHEPRTIYGKIISEADRMIDVDTILYRTIEYGKKHYPDYSFDEQFARAATHIESKYGEAGYLKLWLHTKKNSEGLKKLRSLLQDQSTMRAMCQKYY